MTVKHKSFFRRIVSVWAVLTLCVGLLVAPVGAVGQNIDSTTLNRLNVMLVIDGSGSLVSVNGGTDPNGLRYDAIELFLALLTNSGNHVGAVVFDDDPNGFLLYAEPGSMEGKTDKMALADQIRQAGTRRNTDIGTALLAAVDALNAQNQLNGMDSVVILFSDGRTDLDGNEEAYEKSLQNKEDAIVKAQENGIPVYSICLEASDVADPAELQDISSRTSGGFVAVNSAEDLSQAFEEFYSLIFSASCENTIDGTFADDGSLSYSFDVPSYGAEEVNIILDRDHIDDVALTAPSGAVGTAQLEDYSMHGGNYQVVKLPDPERGNWNLELKGSSGDSVTINILYNIDSTALLSTADGATDYAVGETVEFDLSLYQNGEKVSDPSITQEYQPELTVTNLSTGDTESLPMQAGPDGSFTGTFNGEDYTSYQVDAVLRSGDVKIPAQSLMINIGNSAPVAVESAEYTETVIVTPITGQKIEYDLNEYFQDAQGDALTYEIASSQLVDGTVTLDGNNLTVETARSRSGDLVVRAIDSQGASCDIVFHFKVTNLSTFIFTILIVAALVCVVLIIAGFYLGRPVFKGLLSVADVHSDPMQLAPSHAAFRGKLKLKQFGVVGCGLDGDKCYFVPAFGGRLEFHAPKNTQVYVNGAPQNTVNLFTGCTFEIYADEEETRGIRVTVTSQN